MTTQTHHLYRASSDPVTFPEGATHEEQHHALKSIAMTGDPATGLRRLRELYESIRWHGDKLPGRTSDESIEMVLNWVQQFAAVHQLAYRRLRFKFYGILGAAALIGFGLLWLLTQMPHSA